ncbi:preprotein translocase subunit YajC [Naumannella sp. ID2617S]|nr:preprotein translocase subunit YajC [Naumannella sp. ID2617S]
MPGDALTTGLLVVLMVAAFYFLIIRPQRRRQADQQKMQKAMEPGARVMLSSGIYATVVSVGEKQAVVELSPGVEVTVLKQVVMSVVTPDSPYAEDTPAVESTEQTEAPGTIAPESDAARPAPAEDVTQQNNPQPDPDKT